MSSKTILIKRTLLDAQTSMVSNLELLSSQWTALRRWCLENTSITEIHTLKAKKRSGTPVQIKVKLQSSLTRHQIGLLKFANSQLEGEKNIKFAYVDMHSALKAMLNIPVKNKSIPEFKTKMEVMEILNLADGLDEDAYEGIYEQ